MNHATGMSRSQSFRNLKHDVQHFRNWQWLPAHLTDGFAFHQFHYDRGTRPVGNHLVDGHDAVVVQGRRSFCLARDELRIQPHKRFRSEKFERDQSVQVGILSRPDFPHTTAAQSVQR